MKTPALLPVFAAASVLTILATAGRAQNSTRVVTPPGSTTRVTTTPAGDQVITVTVNNQPVAFEERRVPVMFGGRVLVPLRGVIEKLGGEVKWEPTTRVITGAHAGTEKQFRLRVGSTDALVNGKNETLDAPPRVVNGTTYVPLRFVSETMGARVTWDNTNRTVVITADDEDGMSTSVEAKPSGGR
jgi:hypothetical protein